MNLLKDVPAGTPEKMNLIIEIPKGSNIKFEYDKERNMFAVDRVMYSSFSYPADYGFIPQTHCDDGDPLDGFLFIDQPTYPGILVPARAVGMVEMIDGGEQDNKLICVAAKDPNYTHVKDLKDLPEFFVKKVKHFLEHYKDLKGGKVEIAGIKGADAARAEFSKSVEAYKKL